MKKKLKKIRYYFFYKFSIFINLEFKFGFLKKKKNIFQRI